MRIVDGNNRLAQMEFLVREYVRHLDHDLSFQEIDAELADLSAKYAPPQGRVLIALSGTGEPAGCVAYHRLGEKRCELKRLYVRPEYRGHHVGRELASRMIEVARADGYTEMVLDTFADLKAALATYHALGFTECEAYYDNPSKDAVYLRRDL